MKLFPSTARTSHDSEAHRSPVTVDQSSNIALLPMPLREVPPDSANYQEPGKYKNHILIVDDDAAIRDVLANLLRRSGYFVSCAIDGEAGWEALCTNEFDALITDHAMPRLTGLDLLRRVRSGTLNALPVILISGEMPWGESDLLSLVWPGMAMEKPFSFIEMLTSVRTVLTMTTRAASTYDGQASGGVNRMPPPPVAFWQNDGRTRLPMSNLARVG